MSDETKLYFNGINGATGDYDLPPMTPHQLASIIAGIDEGLLDGLKRERDDQQNHLEAHMAVKEGVDPRVLAQSGWGIIMAHNADPAIKDALSELLNHRRQQAGERYHEYIGGNGYRPGEGKYEFLGRFGAGTGPADPDVVPYYLLIVGDPETIPYRFQNQLDVQYAAGRIYFDTLDEYAQYARSVVQAENGKVALPREAVFFGVRATDDRATMLSADHLIKPLSEKIARAQADWKVNTLLEKDATKAQLANLMGGTATPALLFTASHGMGFPKDDPRLFPDQGAFLCQEWPGPNNWRKPIPPDFYFSAQDVADDARLLGSMIFSFACYGAGTPRFDEFGQQNKTRAEIAPQAFIASLPRRLLSHPKGGILAFVGHVERAWGYSFMWDRAGEQLTAFESTLARLMAGAPVGYALEYFNDRYAEIASDLTAKIDDMRFDVKVDEVKLAGMWTANNDARGYVIIGDPAVRLPVSDQPAAAQRPAIEAATISGTPRATAAVATAAVATASATAEMSASSFDAAAFSFAVQEERSSLTDSIKKFTSELADSLKRAADDISSLEVVTYSTDDLSKVTYSYDTQKLQGELKMRALTHIAFDGDVQVCVPEKDGNIDQAVWDIHLSMVKAAQDNRAAFLSAMAELATKLIGMLGGK